MMFSRTSALCVLLIFAFYLGALDLDTAELEGAGEAVLSFENYEGPVDRFDTRDEIRGIGRSLAEGVLEAGEGTYGEKYRASRVRGAAVERFLAADVVEILDAAEVDHIDNVRRILAGYLETAWGYVPDDADLLARFVTLYNAVYRQDGELLERYRTAVRSAVDVDRLGLALSYREWSGKTQLIIPLLDGPTARSAGTVAPRELLDPRIAAELRERADRGVTDRKELIAFVERVIEKQTGQTEAKLAELDTREADLLAQRAEIESMVADVSAGVENSANQTPEVERSESAPDASQESLAERTQEIDDQLEEIQAERDVVEKQAEETVELTAAVQESYQETALDQQELLVAADRMAVVPFIVESNGYELIGINTADRTPVGLQTVQTASRSIVRQDGGYYVVHGRSHHLLRVDEQTMETTGESAIEIVPGSPLVLSDAGVLAVVLEDGAAFVGQFDAEPSLRNRSSVEVARGTDIVAVGGSVIVQLADGDFALLDVESIAGQ